MNPLVKTPQSYGALSTERDPYEAIGDALGLSHIVGDLFKFRKGEWCSGQNDDEVPIGTQPIAYMPDAKIGWLKWRENKVVDVIMGRIGEGYTPPLRDSLGELDESLWERNPQGEPKSPFTLTVTLVLKAPGEDRLFTFSISSKGGVLAVLKLCKAYSRYRRAHPGELPVIRLESDHYKHELYGKVHVPNLRIIGWADQAEVLAALGEEPESGNGAANQAAIASPSRQDLDDDIPF